MKALDAVAVQRFRYAWPARLQQLAYGGILPNLKRNRLLWAQVPFFLACEFIAAWRLASRREFELLHAHWVIPQGIIAAIVGRLTGTPFIVTAHGGDIYAVKGAIPDAVKRWTLRRSKNVTAVSADLAAAVRGISGLEESSVQVIPMGVDTKQFSPDKADPALREALRIAGPLILFVGRLAEKKGVRYVIEAMPAVLHHLPEARLVIVGDGPLRADLEKLTRQLDITDAVMFLGAKRPEELPPYFASADVFVGPSIVAAGGDTESFGLVFAEAMASGCPVIASDVGGIGEIVEHGISGLLVEQRNPAAIAAALRRILTSQKLRNSLAKNGRARVKSRFDQAVIANLYAKVLLEAAA